MMRAPARRHIHPFPARMAPDIALEKINELAEPGQTVLDPMCGSGTVVRLAASVGCKAVGTDLDPLAVILTRTSTIGSWCVDLEERAQAVVTEARRLGPKRPSWIAGDVETDAFVDYWFAEDQASDLSRLARVLIRRPRTDDPLRVALSRLIITKDGGASLARDTAHSRPHRTRDENDYDVFASFVQAARTLAGLVDDEPPDCRPSIRRSDARRLSFLRQGSVDLVVTSPPYLNAIDYLRGHRMSLIWLGWTMSELRELRGTTVGAERGLRDASDGIQQLAKRGNPCHDDLTERNKNLVYRFTSDINELCRSMGRVVRPRGRLVLVVANSQLRSVPISNSGICKAAAERNGFEQVGRQVRDIPAQHRYLPPPSDASESLDKRMRQEIVFTFSRI